MTGRSIPRVHVEPYRVRFDECGAGGALRTSAHLRYAQDAASVHSSLAGYTRQWYREHGLFWLVRHVDLRVTRPSGYGDVLRVSTEVVGFRRMWARRWSAFGDPDDGIRAEVDVDWVLTGARGRPVRIPDEISRLFAAGLREGYEPGRVELPEPPDDVHRRIRTVEASEVDPLGHLNNAAYVDHLEAALREAGLDFATALPRRVRIEFLQPALIGEEIIAAAWGQGDGWAWTLASPDGRVFARAQADMGPPDA
jgi:acyl-CoA thioesterase FadM